MGRYQELYRIQNNMYIEGSPVYIEAGALLKDIANNSVIAQLKIKNISLKNIISCKISIKAFENNGSELQGIDNFSYLDLKIGPQDSFGSKVPIVLPNEITRKIIVAVTEVVFSDGETWSGNYNVWQPIPSQSYLNKEFEDSEILKQIKIEVGDKAKYKPLVDKGLFLCSCGSIHLLSNQVCSNCKNDFNNLISKIDYEYLNQQKDERLERERVEREQKLEQERIEREEKLEQERIDNIKREEARFQREKKKKKTIIMTIIAVVIIVVPVIAVPIIKSMINYNNAHKLMASEQYDDAISIFISLGEYKDSAEKILEAKYLKALKYCDDGKMYDAYNLLCTLGDYKDCSNKVYEILEAIPTVSLFNSNIGDIVEFGNFRDNTEWIVLDEEDNKLLLISKYAVNRKPYNTEDDNVTWEKCSLRAWLNEEYLSEAFSIYEQNSILPISNVNANNVKYNTDGGNDTVDKVFLLSKDEVNKYFSSDNDRMLTLQDGTEVWWWLRSPGASGSTALSVTGNGIVGDIGQNVTNFKGGIRPVIWVDISKY